MKRALILALAVVLVSVLLMGAAPDMSAPNVLVQTTKLRKGSLPHVVSAYGNIEAAASARKAVMAPLSAIIENVYVRLGEEVPKGTALVKLSPNPQTSASYAQAVSALRVAQQLVRHTKQLRDEYLATKQQLADAEKSEGDARAALKAFRAQGANGPTIIKAPFQAIVTMLSANPGAIVTEGAPLLELAPPNSLILRVGVVPDQAAEIAPGNAVDVVPIGEVKVYHGKVALRGSVVDTATGLVPVEISLPPGALFPGETAEAAIATAAVQGYIVPHDAILVDDSGRPYVVQATNMVAKLVHVRVLNATGDKDVIAGPLDVSAPLVLSGNYQLQDGMKVRFTDPAGKNRQ